MGFFGKAFDKYVLLSVLLIAFLPSLIQSNNFIVKNLIIVAIIFGVSFLNLYLNCKKLKDQKRNPLLDSNIWQYLLKTLPIPIIINAIVLFVITLPVVRYIPIVGQILTVMNSLGITQIIIPYTIFYSTLVAHKFKYC